MSFFGRCVNVVDRYEKIGRLGEGTYGVVYKARERRAAGSAGGGNKIVALKRCIPHHQESDGFPTTALREINALRVCRSHPNIVRLEETVAVSKPRSGGGGGGGVFLVFEYCEHDLSVLVDSYYRKHRQSPFTQSAVKTLMRQLLGALDFVHSHHLIHRDVKLSNLLYKSNEGMLKLADFGLSRPYPSAAAGKYHDALVGSPPPLTPNVASLWYRPPELLFGGSRGSSSYTQAIDVWAAGCVLAELLRGLPLADGKDEIDQIRKIVDCVGVPKVEDWPGLADAPAVRDGTIDLAAMTSPRKLLDYFCYLSVSGLSLITALLEYNPSKRWTASQALECEYLTTDPPVPCPLHSMPRFPTTPT